MGTLKERCFLSLAGGRSGRGVVENEAASDKQRRETVEADKIQQNFWEADQRKGWRSERTSGW